MVVGFRSAQRFAMMASLFPPSLLDSLLFLSHYYYLWWPLLSHPLTLRSFSFYPLFFWSLQNPNNIKLVSSSHNKAGDVIENRWLFLDSYSVRWTVVHWETSFLFSHPFLMALRCFSRKVQMLCFCNQRCACGNSMFSFYAGWEHEKLSKYRRGFSWCEVDLGIVWSCWFRLEQNDGEALGVSKWWWHWNALLAPLSSPNTTIENPRFTLWKASHCSVACGWMVVVLMTYRYKEGLQGFYRCCLLDSSYGFLHGSKNKSWAALECCTW